MGSRINYEPLMGIRFSCPDGHPLHVKEYLAGKRGICPNCGAKFVIPAADDSTESAPVPMPAEATASPATSTASQAANPSVIIPLVAETSIAPVSSLPSPPTDVFSPAVAEPIPQVDAVRSAAPSPVVVTELQQPTSPATKYVANRERSRRNRTRMAILLLLVVIVLAGVLIWMLVAGPAAVDGSQTSADIRSSTLVAWHVERFGIASVIGGSGDEF
jgi:hypothetical protein